MTQPLEIQTPRSARALGADRGDNPAPSSLPRSRVGTRTAPAQPNSPADVATGPGTAGSTTTGAVLEIHVVGEPVGQGRISYGKTGHGYHSNGKTLKPWRRAIHDAAAEVAAGRPPIDGPVRVTITFFLTRPKSVRRPWPHKRNDIDHLCRAVLDSLGPLVWDDSRVCQLQATKVYGHTPGAIIRVAPLDGAPAGERA